MSGQKTQLTSQFLLLYGLCVVAAVASLFLPGGWVFVALIFGVLLIFMALDWKLLPKTSSFVAELEFPSILYLNQEPKAKVRVEAIGSGRSSSIQVAPTIHSLIEDFSGLVDLLGEKPRQGECERRYKVRRLGASELSQVRLVVRSSAGFWKRWLDIPVEPRRFRVFPENRKVSAAEFTEMIRDQSLFLMGSRRQLRSQSPDLFCGMRAYRFPDPVRHIDPKKSAQWDQLMTRVFESEADHRIMVALDVGRAMVGELEDGFKSDFYLSCGIYMLQQALHNRDQGGFFAFSDRVQFSVPMTRSSDLIARIQSGVSRLQATEVETDYLVFLQHIERECSKRCTIVLFTDITRPTFHERFLKILPRLTRRHRVVIVGVTEDKLGLDEQILSLPPSQVKEADFFKLSYDYWMASEVTSFQRQVNQQGAATLLLSQSNCLGVVERTYDVLRSSLFL